MTKDFKYLTREQRGDRVRWRFQKRIGGKLVRQDLPGDPRVNPEANAEYWRLVAGGATRSAGRPRHTVGYVIESYRRSPRYPSAGRTRTDYERVLAYLEANIGNADIRKIPRSKIIEWHQAKKHGRRFADYLVQILSILFQHAIDLDLMRENPAAKIRKHGTEKEHTPWPQWFIDAFRERAEGSLLTAFELAHGVGQRIGDVLEMRWEHVDGDEIFVGQSKTGVELWVTMPARLVEHLARQPRTLTTIACKADGSPYTYHGLNHQFRALRAQIAEELDRPTGGYSWHGLRYVAAQELAEAGNSEALIQSVTGHQTSAMVGKYVRRANQRKMARAAQRSRK